MAAAAATAKNKGGRPKADHSTVQTAVRWSPAELARIDAYIARQKYPPTRTDVIRAAVFDLLDKEKA
jgi:hypothetical protein